ncbi:MAG: caspase family protein, partial [Bradyrhizobiaceae bacterium]|nr:caspase family protein [Bradyrhizobiaceae bacterium]
MNCGPVARCAVGVVLLLAWGSSAWAARVLQAPRGGTVRALVIGIDKYPNLDKAGQLNGAKADADDIVAALEAAGVAKDNVRELVDGAAVRSRVIAEMDRLVAQSKSGDLVLITYSGHGMRVRGYKRWEGKNRSPFHSQMVLANFSPSDDNKGHEVIVDAEMRAWYYRLDAKGVDMLVVMDTCYGGHMREVVSNSGGMMTRELNAAVDDRVHDSFVPIPMKEAEAGADANEMRHLTFFAGATDTSTVPEMSGVDRNNPTQVRGALSYFIARVIDGRLSQDNKGGTSPGRKGPVTRGQLFKFLSPVVREATDARQIIDYGPRTENDSAQQQAIFIISDDAQPPATSSTAEAPQAAKAPEATVSADAVRVAIRNGGKENFAKIEKGRAPFVQSEP